VVRLFAFDFRMGCIPVFDPQSLDQRLDHASGQLIDPCLRETSAI